MQKGILFTNWTAEDFSYTWDAELYEFRSGTSILLPEFLAKHFAKHLVTRELNKKGIPTNSPLRIEMEQKCFSEIIEAETEKKLEIELLNQEKEKTKKGRPKKEKNDEISEEEFEDLNK